jgi:hypothetical protein
MKLYAGKSEKSDFDDLVRSMPDYAFASPRRSTVPLLDFWRVPASRLSYLEGGLGIGPLEEPALSFEYPVEVMAGKGKSSFTDLMITSATVAIAIEAKHREPSYDTCEKWLGDAQGDSNRTKVLDGWLEHLKDKDNKSLTRDRVAGFPYQLIHRTASLFSVDAANRFLIYQVFEEGEVRASVPDLSSFQELLSDTRDFHVGVMSCPFRATDGFAHTLNSWDNGKREGLAEEVREALLAGPIFEFTEPMIKVDRELKAT